MPISRKEFLEVAGRGAASLALANSVFGSLAGTAAAKEAKDVLDSPELRKVREHIAASKEAHIAAVQKDLQQPSVSSWNKGVKEMCDVMMESFRKLGCKEVVKVDTSLPDWPGVLAHYDVGAPKTVVVYMMYDTQPWVEERWSSPPLEARAGQELRQFPEAIVARGAVNSKGPNRFALNAMESIIAVHGKLPVNVIFTCDGAEEQGSPNFHEVLDPWRDRLKKANALLDLSPSQGPDGAVSMALGNKGIMYIELEAHGARWGRGPQKMPIHSSAARPCSTARCGGWWRRCDTMFDPKTNEILIPGFRDDIRPPNAEELELMSELVTKHKDRLFGGERENMKVFAHDWSIEEAAKRLTFDTTLNIDGIWAGYTGEGTATILPEKATVKIDARLVPEPGSRQADRPDPRASRQAGLPGPRDPQDGRRRRVVADLGEGAGRAGDARHLQASRHRAAGMAAQRGQLPRVGVHAQARPARRPAAPWATVRAPTRTTSTSSPRAGPWWAASSSRSSRWPTSCTSTPTGANQPERRELPYPLMRTSTFIPGGHDS